GLPSRHPLLLPWHSFASVAVVGMFWAAAARAGGFLSQPPLQALGTISYGLYLWHYPVLQTLRWLMREPS
ncbi:MAG TPA: acyltransferase family protein, partial [Arenimonas sp.]|nr:acyltransferase family protein [Arenimonas sp.]